MSGTFSRDEVRRVAKLARIALSGEEVDLFARQLAGILAYAEQIAAVDTSRAHPHPPGSNTPLREDVMQPSLERDAVLDAAPDADRETGLFKVPRVLG
jgi:aspartyl-tRNA(Asn)/glutamyl-tRNA(Gln) amidotransferase subunit C